MWRKPNDEPAVEIGSVYVLHFSKPVGTKRQQAQHYIGWASDVDARIAAHRQGKGARLTQVAVERGCELEVAQVIPGVTRDFERTLKNRGSGHRNCAICRGGVPIATPDNPSIYGRKAAIA